MIWATVSRACSPVNSFSYAAEKNLDHAPSLAYGIVMRDHITVDAIRKAGGPAAVGRAFGITSQAVTQWQRVPPERVLEVERLSGVSRHLLRPDVFGPEKAAE